MRGFGTRAAQASNYRTANAAYRGVLAAIMDQGNDVTPRGKPTKELIGASFTLLDASRNIVTAPERRLNYYFQVAEWLWILLGLREVAPIAYFNKNIAAFSDDGKTFFGAYGPWVRAQLPYVVENLKRDPSTRQAVMTIWQQSPPQTKDVPCTVALQFLLRQGKLHCVATMRSNDAWLGLPYDLFNFTRIQAYVAALVGAPVGTYTHQAASLHAYETDFGKIERLLAGAPFVAAPTDVRSPDLTTLPADAVLMFDGLAGLQATMPDKAEIATYDEPWRTYFGLLLYKTVKDPSLLRPPYDALIAAREAELAEAA